MGRMARHRAWDSAAYPEVRYPEDPPLQDTKARTGLPAQKTRSSRKRPIVRSGANDTAPSLGLKT